MAEKCVLQISVESNSKFRLKNNAWMHEKRDLVGTLHLSLNIYHLSFNIY